LRKWQKKKEVVLIVSLFERRAAGVYHNTCAVLDADGSFLGKYRKMHIPDDPLYYEKFYFTPGDLGFPNFETKYGKIGVQICWTNGIPRAPASPLSAEPRYFLSHQHRMAPTRKSGIRRRATRRLENNPARACHRQTGSTSPS